MFRNGGHFEFSNFLPKVAKYKIASISLTVQDRAILSKYIIPTFDRIFKNGVHFDFSNFLPKVAKHKIASISLTVRDRVILSKILIHGVSKSKTGGLLEISNFRQNTKA